MCRTLRIGDYFARAGNRLKGGVALGHVYSGGPDGRVSSYFYWEWPTKMRPDNRCRLVLPSFSGPVVVE
jgi:hypothetical protein